MQGCCLREGTSVGCVWLQVDGLRPPAPSRACVLGRWWSALVRSTRHLASGMPGKAHLPVEGTVDFCHASPSIPPAIVCDLKACTPTQLQLYTHKQYTQVGAIQRYKGRDKQIQPSCCTPNTARPSPASAHQALLDHCPECAQAGDTLYCTRLRHFASEDTCSS